MGPNEVQGQVVFPLQAVPQKGELAGHEDAGYLLHEVPGAVLIR